MAGLACGEASLLAWRILETGAHFFVTIPDAAAVETMRLLARGCGGDRPIVGGESGVAGLAGLAALAAGLALYAKLLAVLQYAQVVSAMENVTSMSQVAPAPALGRAREPQPAPAERLSLSGPDFASPSESGFEAPAFLRRRGV